MDAIEVFADIVCPFTHVGLRAVLAERARRGSKRLIRVRAWPLELINGKPLDASLVAHEIDALGPVAPRLFRGFDPRRFPVTSMPAFGLVAAGYRAGFEAGEAASFMVRDALFERGADVGDPDVIASIARELGLRTLDPADADAAVRADWERGEALGVLGSPHFFDRGRSWFCPSLRIAKVDGALAVTRRDEVEAFYDALFD